jgi:hypothetical protein
MPENFIVQLRNIFFSYDTQAAKASHLFPLKYSLHLRSHKFLVSVYDEILKKYVPCS